MEQIFQLMFFVSFFFVFIYFLYTTFLAMLPAYKTKKSTSTSPEDFHYVFCIPCLNEERVIANTVKSILALPYSNLTVIVVDDDSEDATVQRVREIQDPRVRVIERKLPNARLGKGESLNYAYNIISTAVRRMKLDPSNVIIGIIDGDGRPGMNLLEETSKVFADPQVGAAQARIRMTNRKQILPFLQDMEFYTMVSAIQNSRAYVQSVGLGGNGQFSRLSAMQEFGDEPWTKCLLEDFDFGLRLTLNGWKISHLENGVVYQQGLTSVKRFIRQRSRWVQGNMQSLSYIKSILDSHLTKGAKMDLLYFLAQPWLNLAGSVITLVSWVLIITYLIQSKFQLFLNGTSTISDVTSILIWLNIMFGPAIMWSILHYMAIKKEETFVKCIGIGLCMPVYNLLVLPSIWMAFYRHIKGTSSWIKTERIAEEVSV